MYFTQPLVHYNYIIRAFPSNQDADRGSRAYDPATGTFLAPHWSAEDLMEDILSGGGGLYRLFADNDPVNGFGKGKRKFTSYEGNGSIGGC